MAAVRNLVAGFLFRLLPHPHRRINPRVHSGSLAFLAFETKRTVQYLTRFHRFDSVTTSREYVDQPAAWVPFNHPMSDAKSSNLAPGRLTQV